MIRSFPLALVLALCLAVVFGGCMTRGAYQGLVDRNEQLVRERDDLLARVQRLQLERDSLADEFVQAQDSFEDERVARVALEEELARVRQRLAQLEARLAAEQEARESAARALAEREAEITALQSTYDGLVSDLESEVTAGQIKIERLKEGLRLDVSDEVLFASGSADLDAEGEAVLSKVAAQLKTLNDSVEVRGHTDDRPIRGSLARVYPSNWELAAARAARVARLLENEGVSGDRLSVVSLGPNDPVVPNDSAQNRARNRRIEIRLKPREQPSSGADTAGGSAA